MRNIFKRRAADDGMNHTNKEKNGGDGTPMDDDETELPSVSTFLRIHPESPTLSIIEFKLDDEVAFRHSTPRSVSRYDEFPTEDMKLARMLSPIPEQESTKSASGLIKQNIDAVKENRTEKTKKKSRIPIAVKGKPKSVTSEKTRLEIVKKGLVKSKNERNSPTHIPKACRLDTKTESARYTKPAKKGVAERSKSRELTKQTEINHGKDKVSKDMKSEVKRASFGVRTQSREKASDKGVKVKKVESTKTLNSIKEKERTAAKGGKCDVKQTKTKIKGKRKAEEERTRLCSGSDIGKVTPEVGRNANSRGSYQSEDNTYSNLECENSLIDTRGKKTEELHEEFARLCAEIKANKERIWENDDKLYNQDKELEGLMENLQVLGEIKEGLIKKEREIKEDHRAWKEKASDARVDLRTIILDSQMYENESENIQEEIWAIRNEIIHFEFLPEATEDLKCQLRTVKEENEKLENELNGLENGDHCGLNIPYYDGYGNESSDVDSTFQETDETDDNKRLVVLPKIHRRGNANNTRSFFKKIDKRPKLKNREPLPDINIAHANDKKECLSDLDDRNKLPPINTHRTNTSSSEQNDTKFNPYRPLPSIGQESREADVNTRRNDDSIIPKPPSEKKPDKKFTRKNIFQKLKSIFTK